MARAICRSLSMAPKCWQPTSHRRGQQTQPHACRASGSVRPQWPCAASQSAQCSALTARGASAQHQPAHSVQCERADATRRAADSVHSTDEAVTRPAPAGTGPAPGRLSSRTLAPRGQVRWATRTARATTSRPPRSPGCTRSASRGARTRCSRMHGSTVDCGIGSLRLTMPPWDTGEARGR